jgi:hypothetical protein
MKYGSSVESRQRKIPVVYVIAERKKEILISSKPFLRIQITTV